MYINSIVMYRINERRRNAPHLSFITTITHNLLPAQSCHNIVVGVEFCSMSIERSRGTNHCKMKSLAKTKNFCWLTNDGSTHPRRIKHKAETQSPGR